MNSDVHGGLLPTESQCLLDAISMMRHHAGGAGAGRPEQARSVLGCQVGLPAGVPLWRHVTTDGRELVLIPSEEGSFTVHSLEPAGASFLVHRDGQPHARRGPALTLRRVGVDAEDRLVVFSDDLDELV